MSLVRLQSRCDRALQCKDDAGRVTSFGRPGITCTPHVIDQRMAGCQGHWLHFCECRAAVPHGANLSFGPVHFVLFRNDTAV